MLAMYTIGGTLNHIDFSKTEIAVYVKELNDIMYKLRNKYLVFMGN